MAVGFWLQTEILLLHKEEGALGSMCNMNPIAKTALLGRYDCQSSQIDLSLKYSLFLLCAAMCNSLVQSISTRGSKFFGKGKLATCAESATPQGDAETPFTTSH